MMTESLSLDEMMAPCVGMGDGGWLRVWQFGVWQLKMWRMTV